MAARSELRPWRSPPDRLAKRNLGLACVSAGERDQSASRLNEGFRLLAEVQAVFPKDPAVLTSLGLVLLRKNVAAEAVRLFGLAVRADPVRASFRLNLAVALHKAGQQDKAVVALERAIELEPLLEDAYILLAEIHPKKRREVLDRYLQLMPGSIQARLGR